jgi:hypothetical protein
MWGFHRAVFITTPPPRYLCLYLRLLVPYIKTTPPPPGTCTCACTCTYNQRDNYQRLIEATEKKATENAVVHPLKYWGKGHNTVQVFAQGAGAEAAQFLKVFGRTCTRSPGARPNTVRPLWGSKSPQN